MSAAKKATSAEQKQRSVVLEVLENPKLWAFLAKFTLGVLFFISGFTTANTNYFEQYPLFDIPFLAEFLIGLAAGAFGFHTLPIIAARVKDWFEDFLAKEINKIVSRFWDEQSKRMSQARRDRDKRQQKEREMKNKEELEGAVLLDTSILIDGRLLDIVETGFFDWQLVVPQAVLDEAHLISDSSDDLKRQRGRRGLDMINALKKVGSVRIFKAHGDISKTEGVDKELIRLAKKYKTKIMTLDFNLNKVAQAENIPVLNVNELTNALKTNILPGENLKVKIVQKGKERGQGVGYLEDGTMIVVVGAEGKIGKTLSAQVSRVIQTEAGKMIFCET